MTKSGFTLLEIAIVIVIIGILGTLGFAQYTIDRERALGRVVVANLRLIAAAQRVYRMDYGQYYRLVGGIAELNRNLKLSLTGSPNWRYLFLGGGVSFHVFAFRTGGTTGCIYYLGLPNVTEDRPRVLGGWCP